MIDNPLLSDWRDLQQGVGRILGDIGLAVEIEKTLTTPRGAVTVDVFAVDEGSVDQISYVVECKNWSKPVDQSIIHAFTTVMHETGANIGFVVSKHGLQSGAVQYTASTNICGLTYLELQQRYFHIWWNKFFCT